MHLRIASESHGIDNTCRVSALLSLACSGTLANPEIDAVRKGCFNDPDIISHQMSLRKHDDYNSGYTVVRCDTLIIRITLHGCPHSTRQIPMNR